jgi:hypothetical protein
MHPPSTGEGSGKASLGQRRRRGRFAGRCCVSGMPTPQGWASASRHAPRPPLPVHCPPPPPPHTPFRCRFSQLPAFHSSVSNPSQSPSSPPFSIPPLPQPPNRAGTTDGWTILDGAALCSTQIARRYRRSEGTTSCPRSSGETHVWCMRVGGWVGGWRRSPGRARAIWVFSKASCEGQRGGAGRAPRICGLLAVQGPCGMLGCDVPGLLGGALRCGKALARPRSPLAPCLASAPHQTCPPS